MELRQEKRIKIAIFYWESNMSFSLKIMFELFGSDFSQMWMDFEFIHIEFDERFILRMGLKCMNVPQIWINISATLQ